MPTSHAESPRLLKEPEGADSFAACVTAALAGWGRPASYECVAALAGTAFSPALDEGEPCASRWTEAGADLRIAFMGHALGFEPRRASADALAAQGGAVLIRRAGAAWRLAGNGAGQPPPDGQAAYLLSPAGRSLSQGEALREALAFGARIATPDFRCGDCAFGGALYDAWRERAQGGQLCPPCGDGGWRCAARTGRRVRRSHLAAAAFLRRVGAFLPRARRLRLAGQAAGTYERMAERLAPYSSGERVRGAVATASGRADYAAAVGRVRDLHVQAARRLALLAGIV